MSECEMGFDATGVGGWCVTHKRWLCPYAASKGNDMSNEKFTKREELGEVPDFRLKSWKDDFTGDDVSKHLSDNELDEFIFDGVAGDGDLLLRTHKGLLTCVGLNELLKLQKVFSCPHITIEPYEQEMMITLSWNAAPRPKPGAS